MSFWYLWHHLPNPNRRIKYNDRNVSAVPFLPGYEDEILVAFQKWLNETTKLSVAKNVAANVKFHDTIFLVRDKVTNHLRWRVKLVFLQY